MVATRQLRVGLGVDLEKTDIRLKLGGNSLVDRSHGLARPAPFRPEIHHHGNVIALDVGRKALGRDRNRMAGEERLMAVATLGFARRPVDRNSVDAVTVRTNDVPELFHDLLSLGLSRQLSSVNSIAGSKVPQVPENIRIFSPRFPKRRSDGVTARPRSAAAAIVPYSSEGLLLYTTTSCCRSFCL